jgi:hypothetical protein
MITFLKSFPAQPARSLLSRLTPQLVHAALLAAGLLSAGCAEAAVGARLPWTTYEAETMAGTGEQLAPKYGPFLVEMESSGQRCVRLGLGQHLEFSAKAAASTLVLRYSLPDSKDGTGTSALVELLVNGKALRSLSLSSRYSHLYGNYPFTNNPADAKHRNFYDEVRVKDLGIAPGDVVRLQLVQAEAGQVIVDLVDLELAPAPLVPPAKALSVLDFGAGGKGLTDDTVALRDCIAAARRQGRVVWVPAGDYKITGDIVLPSDVSIQGAGMWHTTFVGDETLYRQAERRVRFKMAGSRIHLADFAIVGRLNYRIDDEANDGIIGAGCADSTVSRIWVEHTKAGVWIYNGSRLVIEGCRFRDLLADGINLCVGTHGSVIQDCSARGTGDDCFAIWPAPSDQGYVGDFPKPGNNVIRNCTGQLPFLANGGALYGGQNNRIEDCLFTDITAGCGILISTTFPTVDPASGTDNNFSGTTLVSGCELVRCGGYDHTWAWRGALQVCVDRYNISGLLVRNVTITDSLSVAFSLVAPGAPKGHASLTETRVERLVVSGTGLGSTVAAGLQVHPWLKGGLTLSNSQVAVVQNDAPGFVVARE